MFCRYCVNPVGSTTKQPIPENKYTGLILPFSQLNKTSATSQPNAISMPTAPPDDILDNYSPHYQPWQYASPPASEFSEISNINHAQPAGPIYSEVFKNNRDSTLIVENELYTPGSNSESKLVENELYTPGNQTPKITNLRTVAESTNLYDNSIQYGNNIGQDTETTIVENELYKV